MEVTTHRPHLLIMNVPAWFQDPEFIAAIEKADNCIMTWHKPGQPPNDYSDTLLFVDPSLNGEGSECGVIPDRYWDEVIRHCREHLHPSQDHHVLVKLTNLQS